MSDTFTPLSAFAAEGNWIAPVWNHNRKIVMTTHKKNL
jgi:hypothetical protein